jgi:hypothetical protein
MISFQRFRRSVLPIAVGLTLVSCASALATVSPNRTWVSGVGDDINPCTRVEPCKTFAGAIAKTPAGGTITALDSGGFGSLTITKALTIDGGGAYGSALVGAGVNDITVVAGANDDVTLRGLEVTNGTACTGPGTGTGIRFITGHSLRVENVIVHGFAAAGIDASPTTAAASLTIDHSDLRDNCTTAINVAPTAASLPVQITNSTFTHNATAISAGNGAQVRLGHNTISGNTTGLATTGTGVISSFGDNHIAGNPSFGTAADGVVPALLPALVAPVIPPVLPPTPQTVTGPGSIVLVPTHTTCTIPKLANLTITQARKAATKAKCQVGTVGYTPKHGKKRNRIYAQTPSAGTLQYRGAIINVTVNAHRPKPKRRAKAHKAALGGATRTWVFGVGDDANPCSRTAPCKTLAGAIAKTMSGGEIDVLDSGDLELPDPGAFTAATINDGVTVNGAGPSGNATVTAGSTGITINPTLSAFKDVTLENLTIVASSPCTGGIAINDVAAGGSLRLHNVAISGFSFAVMLTPAADQSVSLDHVTATDNCADGVLAQRPGGHVGVLIDGSTLRGNGVGVAAGDGATVRIADSTISGNTTAGLSTTGGGTLFAWPDNDIFDNAAGATPTPLALR